jgi:hypothetical protein
MLGPLPVGEAAATAGELVREVSAAGDKVAFRYRFHDAGDRARELQFALPARAYEEARQGLERPDSAAAERRFRERMEERVARGRAQWQDALAARIDVLAETLPEGVSLSYEFEDGKLRWSLAGHGLSQARLDELGRALGQRIRAASRRLEAQKQQEVRREGEELREAIYGDLAFTRHPGLGEDLLRPDYRVIARRAGDLMRPVADAIAARAGGDRRARIALALAFLQSIPYDELTDRNAANGIGFAVPAQMLHLNRGDCDSKATAMAALMAHLAPSVDTAILLLPGHAVLAAALPPQGGDRTVELDGETYVLMEPAGPAVLPVGRVGDDSRRLLDDDRVLSVVRM